MHLLIINLLHFLTGALSETFHFCHYKCYFGDSFSSLSQKVMIFGKLCLLQLKQVLLKVIWDELRSHPHGRQWTRPLCVLAVQCPAYEYNHSAMDTLRLHCSATFFPYVTLHCLIPKKHLPLPVGGIFTHTIKQVIHWPTQLTSPNDIIVVHT